MKEKEAENIKAVTTKTLGDFIRLEEGSTGKQSALKGGAMIGSSVLAQVLFSALNSADATINHSACSNCGLDDLVHSSRSILWGWRHWSAL